MPAGYTWSKSPPGDGVPGSGTWVSSWKRLPSFRYTRLSVADADGVITPLASTPTRACRALALTLRASAKGHCAAEVWPLANVASTRSTSLPLALNTRSASVVPTGNSPRAVTGPASCHCGAGVVPPPLPSKRTSMQV